ncbi:MAG: GGDEF and EAL domain-containing protein [Psychrobium sp.]|nr:GGDEF and EAL domain-containing protein [Psychrobium sp.]
MLLTCDCTAIDIPEEIIDNWQATLEILAQIASVPATLIMKKYPTSIEVFSGNTSTHSPYKRGESHPAGHSLYSERVIETQQELLIPDALIDPLWSNNPDIALGMVSYCGLPINWPNGENFGTICMLDDNVNHYSVEMRGLLESFRASIESGLEITFQKHQLSLENQDLEHRILQRTKELEQLNDNLMQEIDSRCAAEQLLEFQQKFDAVTGLPKELHLMAQFNQHAANGTKKEPLAVLYVQLSNHKEIHDSFGAKISELVKVYVAQELATLTAQQNVLACVSDNTFCILYICQSQQSNVDDFCNQLCKHFNQLVMIDGVPMTVAIQVGVSQYPHDATKFSDLTQKASIALSHYNVGDEKHYNYFNRKLAGSLSRRLQIESLLVGVIERQELLLNYQPFIDTKTGAVVGAEVLIRWDSPELGMVPPDSFIGAAEQSGQIIEIGYFVLRSAIKQLAYWHELYDDKFYIAINVSPLQFHDENLVPKIASLLKRYNLPANAIEIEVTESALIRQGGLALSTLNRLSKQGVKLSLDDFGTGYSSLSYLQNYPFDSVKIDRSFIQEIEQSFKSRELVSTIIAMAANLNLSVVAEGIENINQAQFVATKGANILQGYHYGKPINAKEFSQQHFMK